MSRVVQIIRQRGVKGDPGESAEDAILFTSQTLTDPQRAQARTNIAAQPYSANLDRLDGTAAQQRAALGIDTLVSRWRNSTTTTVAVAGDKIRVSPGHTIQLPTTPTAGDTVSVFSAQPWRTANVSFDSGALAFASVLIPSDLPGLLEWDYVDSAWTPRFTPSSIASTPVDYFASAVDSLASYSPRLAFNFSDLSSLWQDSSKTVPVTNYGQGVGSVSNLSGVHPGISQVTSSKRPLFSSFLQSGTPVNGLLFDGSDDCLLSSFNLSDTDELTVIFAVRPLANSLGMIAELTENASANDGAFYVANRVVADNDFAVASRVTSLEYTQKNGKNISTTHVMAATINGGTTPAAKLYFNGVYDPSATTAGSRSAGNFANSTLHIGQRAATAFPYNGYLCGWFFLCGAIVPDAVILSVSELLQNEVGL